MDTVGKFILRREGAALLVVDIQERLAAAMDKRERVIRNATHLIECAKLLGVPVVLTEQYPRGLGPTVGELRDALPAYEPIEKMTFDCCGEPGFLEEMGPLAGRTVIVCGMEAHVCVLQTTLSLLGMGRAVHVAGDAVCSRRKENWLSGLDVMRQAGAVVTNTETVLFQLLGRAGTDEFKTIVGRIK